MSLIWTMSAAFAVLLLVIATGDGQQQLPPAQPQLPPECLIDAPYSNFGQRDSYSDYGNYYGRYRNSGRSYDPRYQAMQYLPSNYRLPTYRDPNYQDPRYQDRWFTDPIYDPVTKKPTRYQCCCNWNHENEVCGNDGNVYINRCALTCYAAPQFNNKGLKECEDNFCDMLCAGIIPYGGPGKK